MFSFELPARAVLTVLTPEGTTLSLVHAGNGSFLSRVPPIALAGMSLDGAQPPEVPVTWDGLTLPATAEVLPVLHMFDVRSAHDAVASAASNGDPQAQQVMQEFKAAAETLAAQDRAALEPAESEGGAAD